MNKKYYVSLYFDKNYEPVFPPVEEILAEEFRYKRFGYPRQIPSLADSADSGNFAFQFDEIEQAAGFAQKALDLEQVLSVRIGVFR